MTSLKITLSICILSCLLNISCQNKSEKTTNGLTKTEIFGKLSDGREGMKYTLKSSGGMEVVITNFGGHILSWHVPDKFGELADITLGCDSLSDYEKGTPFFGALVGRYGNRIGGAQFVLDGKAFILAKNNGPNSLHGGKIGFDKKLWEAKLIDGEEPALQLSYTSPDMEEGYPGTLKTTVIYKVLSNNTLEINYEATTDKPTVVNLTNHAYFNLAGTSSKKDILKHQLTLVADKYLPVDSTLIPTGEKRPVVGTAFDFTMGKEIRNNISELTDSQIVYGKGYDHCFVFTDSTQNLKLGARVYESQSGRVMEMLTTEPAVQFYTGNFLDGSAKGKGVSYGYRSGFCLETQHYPDAPNKPYFPSTVLRPGQTYKSKTVYRFSIKK